MTAGIARRDFLGSVLLGSGMALLEGFNPSQLFAAQDDFTGYGGIGEYSNSNGNTLAVLQAGHAIRDRVYDRVPTSIVETGEQYDCVIVGGGISGLAAALFFQRYAAPGMRCLVLENHPIFGGEARQNEFLVDGKRLVAHQGSAIYQVQHPYSFLASFYESIGLKNPKLTYQRWSGPDPEMPLSSTPYEAAGLGHGAYGFWFGAKFGKAEGMWVMDPIGHNLASAPVPNTTKAELLRWLKDEPANGKPFEHPKVEGDAISRYLDSITLEQHYMERFGLSRDTVRTFLSPVAGGGSGLGPDALSGYSEYAFETAHPLPEEDGGSDQMFPGGNTTIARLMVKTLLPDAIPGPASVEGVTRSNVSFDRLDVPASASRVRLSSTVVNVQHDGDPSKARLVNVVYEKDGRLYRVKAKSTVMAGGSWTTKHTVKDLPQTHRDAYAQFYRSPCLMANVAVRNWRFLYKMGMSGCRWFEGLGNYFDIRKMALTGLEDPTISPDSPTVITVKILYSYPGSSTEEQGNRGRMELLSTSFRTYEQKLRDQFNQMFSAGGFEASRDIAGIILNRWGHAYLSPQPGFFFGKYGKPAPRQVLRDAPFGRIAFANTDLAGAMDHRFSILEAQRAVRQLLDQVLV